MADGVKDAVDRLSQNEYFTFIGYINSDQIDGMLRSNKANADFTALGLFAVLFNSFAAITYKKRV